MIYTNPYSRLQPVDMFGAVQEVKQAKALEQQRQNTLANQVLANQQKAYEQKQRIATTLFKSANKFANLPDDERASSWQSYRSQWVSYLPDANEILPNVWDPKDQANNKQLNSFISFLGDFVPEETKTLAQGETLIGLRGGQSRVIAQGAGKPTEAFKMVEVKTETGTVRIPEGYLPSGSILSGLFVYDRKNRMLPVPINEYFAKYPNDYPDTAEVIPAGVNAKPSVNSPSIPTIAPTPVPGQTELPPMQFNAPSSTNRSGETNQGFPIDMSMAVPGQPTNALAAMNMPAGGMAAPVSPTMGGNALFGGMGMALPVNPQQLAESMNMLAQEQDQFMPPNQFAQLRPAGSAPNRFGSPGVEGMEFAATGASGQPRIIGGMVTYPSQKPRGESKETFRDMTPEEIRASGRDPARFSGQVSSLGQKKFEALPSATAAELESVQLESAKIQLEAQKQKLKEEQKKAKKEQQEAVSLLRGIKRIESALFELQSNPLFDTGTIDQFFMSKTDAGKKLLAANAAILPSVKSEGRVAGEGAFSDFDAKLLIQRLPTMANPMSSNWETINQLKTDVLAAYGVQAAVSNKAERDALPPGTIYVDINTGIKYQKGEK